MLDCKYMFLNTFFHFQLQIQSIWQIASTHRPSRSNKKILQKLRSTDRRNQKTREWSLAEAKARNGPLCGQLASHAWPIILHWAAKGQWVLFTPRRLVWKSKTFWTPELVTPPPPHNKYKFCFFFMYFFLKKGSSFSSKHSCILIHAEGCLVLDSLMISFSKCGV